MASSAHPGCNMIGPAWRASPEQAAALRAGRTGPPPRPPPVMLVPVDCAELVGRFYRGARNCELHFGQVRGQCQPHEGVVMPTFLPESAYVTPWPTSSPPCFPADPRRNSRSSAGGWARRSRPGIDIRTTGSARPPGRAAAAPLRRLPHRPRRRGRGRRAWPTASTLRRFLPAAFRQLARVGDETGSGAEVFRQLADHYDAAVKRRRIFLAAITWPMIQWRPPWSSSGS